MDELQIKYLISVVQDFLGYWNVGPTYVCLFGV